MKTRCIFPVIYLLSLPLFAQMEIARGALDNHTAILNKPTMVKPAKATALEKNWYNVDMDFHMLTDEANFRQIVSVWKDIENYGKIFDARKTKLRTSVISGSNDDAIVNFTSITVAFITVTIEYRANVKTLESGNTKFISEIRQIDNETNKEVRNYLSQRYIEEVTIGGKKYVYIRIVSQSDTYVGFRLPSILSIIEKNSINSNEDTFQMLMQSAKTR